MAEDAGDQWLWKRKYPFQHVWESWVISLVRNRLIPLCPVLSAKSKEESPRRAIYSAVCQNWRLLPHSQVIFLFWKRVWFPLALCKQEENVRAGWRDKIGKKQPTLPCLNCLESKYVQVFQGSNIYMENNYMWSTPYVERGWFKARSPNGKLLQGSPRNSATWSSQFSQWNHTEPWWKIRALRQKIAIVCPSVEVKFLSFLSILKSREVRTRKEREEERNIRSYSLPTASS